MDTRDERILNHIGRYTITIRKIVEDLFFDGGSCGNALDRLVDSDLIQRVSRAFEGNYSYYQLTPRAAKSRGLAPNRAAVKGETSLAQNLAALWFSCANSLWRKRLDQNELEALFGAPPGGNVIHVAQNDRDDQTAVFRLFIPGENTGIKRGYTKMLRDSAYRAVEDKRLLPWIERGTYRFAVLVHSAVRMEDLAEYLQSESLPVQVQIEKTPTPSTLPAFLPNRRGV